MKGVLKAPDGKRPLTPHEAIPKGRLKGRVRETLAGMKGWRPSALAKGSKTGSGFLSGRNSAGHRIESPVFSRAPWIPVDAGSHGYRLHGAGRLPSRTRRTTVRDLKTVPALRLLQETLRTPKRRSWKRKTEANKERPPKPSAWAEAWARACAYTPC